MTPGQFLTVLTLGAAAVISLASVALGIGIYASPRLYMATVFALQGAADKVPQPWLAALVAGGGVAGAAMLVKAQQAMVSWLVKREIEGLRRQVLDVEMALGTEKAMEYASFKGRQLVDHAQRPTMDLFGSRRSAAVSEQLTMLSRAPDAS